MRDNPSQGNYTVVIDPETMKAVNALTMEGRGVGLRGRGPSRTIEILMHYAEETRTPRAMRRAEAKRHGFHEFRLYDTAKAFALHFVPPRRSLLRPKKKNLTNGMVVCYNKVIKLSGADIDAIGTHGEIEGERRGR